jgi:hypothetical protein
MSRYLETDRWVQLPNGFYVAEGRMQRKGNMAGLHYMHRIEIEGFNRMAERFGIHFDREDPPILRMMKYSAFLKRKNSDGSFVPSNQQYGDMVLDVTAAKADGREPLSSFHDVLKSTSFDVTRDIIRLNEKAPEGRYKATLLSFDDDCTLVPVDDIVVAGSGWIRALDENGYPTETSKSRCNVEWIERGANSHTQGPSMPGMDVSGYWHMDPDPSMMGRDCLVLRGPHLNEIKAPVIDAHRSIGSSRKHVGALRFRADKETQRRMGELEEAQKHVELNPIAGK